MRNNLLLLLTGFLPLLMVAQNCPPPTQVEYLSSQNSEVLITNSQLMWSNTQTATAHYYVPQNSGISPFYAGGLWIAGKDPSQVLHVAASRYNSEGTDFYSGPLTTDGTMTATNCLGYDYIYQISRTMATTHLAYYTALNNGTADEEFPFGYIIPQELFDYPAHGNTSLGEAEYLAPFYDFDNDGSYDPSTGDCPLFTGMGVETNCSSCDQLLGDIAFFWINNDAGGIHGESFGQPLGIEIQNTAYAFTSNSSAEVSNSTFYQKKIINRSNVDYHDVYVGVYVDADIGNSTDDYVACDIQRKLGYAFNGDPYDEPVSTSMGYGQNAPAAGVMFLNTPQAVADNIDNDEDGLVDNETLGMTNFMYYNISGVGTNDPNMPLEYYNYLTSHWKDGTPLTYGGNGHDNNTGVITPHMFPDDYVLPGFEPWTEATVGTPPGDRRFLMSAGPFNLVAGEEVCLQFATVIGFPTENLTAIEVMKNNADYITNQFDEFCTSNTASVNSLEASLSKINWNTQTNELTFVSNLNGTFNLTVISALGQIVTIDRIDNQSSKLLNNLKPGVYVVKVEDSLGNITTKKINKL